VKAIIFHDEAGAEFDDAIAYYEKQEDGLGLGFHLEVERAVEIIERHPQIGSRYKSTRFRQYVLARFPHIIFYLELDDVIWIAAVAHSRRKPHYWKNRASSVPE
jgi:toxin ParE1/3/4